MFPLQKYARGLQRNLLSSWSTLIDHCVSHQSPRFAKTIHAQLLKRGLFRHTFLGNRCLDIYARLGSVEDVSKAFDDIPDKNLVSWNIYLKGLVRCCDIAGARLVFDRMPLKDVVSWNSLLTGYVSNRHVDSALELFWNMQNARIKLSEYTYSMLTSLVPCANQGKQIHGRMVRSGINVRNVVLGNSLIDMYGKLGLVDSAHAVFLTMERLDVISWNTLISGLYNSQYFERAMELFLAMLYVGQPPDEFTVSLMVTICCKLQELEKGKQIFALSVKMGFLSNAIVSSAIIDLFAKCNRLDDSVKFFEELDEWDIALCNSMISSYICHGFWEVALSLFVLVLQKGLRPTGFTLSIVLNAVSPLFAEQGSQFHSLVVKTGLESDVVLASSLLEMYTRVGLMNSAVKIFLQMAVRDLISWNSIIMGLTRNGCVVEAIGLFKKLLQEGPPPDRITFFAALQACNYGGLPEGQTIFSCMEKEYGIVPEKEHYECILNLLIRTGNLQELVDVTKKMPFEPNYETWEMVLCLCIFHGDLELMEKVVERLIAGDPLSSLPYLVLARAYEMRGRWEGIIRVRKAMKEMRVRRAIGCSWIGVHNCVFSFKGDQIQHHGGDDMYLVLDLLARTIGEDYSRVSLLDDYLNDK